MEKLTIVAESETYSTNDWFVQDKFSDLDILCQVHNFIARVYDNGEKEFHPVNYYIDEENMSKLRVNSKLTMNDNVSIELSVTND